MRAKNSIKIKQKQKLKHVLPVLHFKLSHWVERTSLGMKQAQNGYLNNTEKKKKNNNSNQIIKGKFMTVTQTPCKLR